MRLLLAACLLVGCHRLAEPVEAPVEPSKPEPVPSVEPLTKPAPAPAPSFKATRIARRDNTTLCAYDAANAEHCRHIDIDHFKRQVVSSAAKPGYESTLTRKGVACTSASGLLTCGSTKTAVTEHYGGYYVYLEEPGALSWYQPDTGTTELRTMTPFPDPIAQLAIGFRVGCARTTKAEVYCWSDPAKPRKITTPANVVDIAIQDPFELCVRTSTGELHCTAPFTQEGLMCSKHSLACGTGEIEKVELETKFDPLTKLLRPLKRVALAHAATEVERDDDPIYQFCLESLAVGPSNAGACALGDAGKVSCFSSCRGAWRVGAVAGLPSTIQRIWSEGATGYALAADGTLYWWPRTRDCDASASTTAKPFAGLPPILDLAAPLSLQSGPQSWDPLRCALATSGDVRCWRSDRMTGVPGAVFDPMR